MWQYSPADWQRKCSRQCNEPNGQNTGPCTQEQVLECHFQKWTRYIHCAWRLDSHENKKVVEVSRILLRRILPSCQCRSNGGINWRSPSSTPALPPSPAQGCKASRLAPVIPNTSQSPSKQNFDLGIKSPLRSRQVSGTKRRVTWYFPLL